MNELFQVMYTTYETIYTTNNAQGVKRNLGPFYRQISDSFSFLTNSLAEK